MACYHPLKGYQVGLTALGKPDYFIASYESDHVEVHDTYTVAVMTPYVSRYARKVVREYITVPCGQCVGCRLAYSRMWADRCVAEATQHDSNYFVTLTYDNDNIPYNEYVDDDGVIKQSMTLKKRDIQLFMKRLRKAHGKRKIRFFAAGEYGSKTARPHYHLILFGLFLEDLRLYRKTELGFNLYNSNWLSEIWPYGHVVIADVTWETCAYTARYILKKQTGDAAKVYEEYNMQQEFTTMSRKPGIARDFYEKNKQDYLLNREVNISTPKGGRKISNIKYFDKLLEVDYPIEREEQKELIKQQCEIVKQKKLENTTLSYLEMLQVEEDIKLKRIAALQRKEI